MPRLSLLACTAGLAGLAFAGPAAAQTVRMFDEPPPLEVLRGIMVPESKPGASRRIVMPHVDMPADSSVQHAAARVPSPPPPAPAAPPAATAAPQPAAMSVPVPAPVPAPAAAKPATPGVVGFRINFALDSATLAPADLGFVQRIGELLQTEPQLRLRIEGHTDARGSDEYNRDLSVRRGKAVAAYLVEHMGIGADRLRVIGKGKSEPLAADPFDPSNRRVQFARLDQPG